MPLPKFLRLQKLAIPSRLTVVLVSLLLAALAVFFWLWFVIVPARVSILCPKECKCDPGGYHVQCRGPLFTSVSSIRLTNIRELELHENNITLFENGSFVLLTDLEILRVYNCELRTIQLGAFNGITDLTDLQIIGNELSEIIPGTFENMRNLESLDLQNNSLEHLDNGVFSGFIKLKYIKLGYNRLQHVHPYTLLGLPNLQNISFKNNPSLQIPTDRPFIKSLSLSYLDMSFCNIRSLSVETFANVSALEWLDLSNNILKNLDIYILRALDKLKYIDLGGNNLYCVPPDTFLGLINLQNVSFPDNLGLQIPTDRTFITSHTLSSLDIALCNIRSLSGVTLENVSAQEWLDLRYVNIIINIYRALDKLKYINLEGTKLKYIHPDTFLGLPNLQNVSFQDNPGLQIPTDRPFIKSHSLSYLDLSQCNIRSLSFETFANVSALEWLDLSSNYLRTVDINILRGLPKLSTLYLYGNRLHCDCQLQEVWRWCKDRNILTVFWFWGVVPVCATPREVNVMGWGVLEKGQCLEGNIQYYGEYNNSRYSYTRTEDFYGYGYDVDFLRENQVPIYAFPFLFGTTGSIIILIIIICNKDMRTLPNIYIINLAISDIIYLTAIFSEAVANRMSYSWLYGDIMCTFLPFCRRLSVGLSAYFVALLSILRYRITVNPLNVRVSSPPTWRVTVATICGVWIVAALFAVPSALSKNLCKEFWFLNQKTYYQRVVIFELLVSCVIPLCVIAFSYIVTACHLVESSCSISEGTQNPQLNTRRNTAKIVVGLTVVFLISYVPYHVLWSYIICNEEVSNIYHRTVHIILDSNGKLQYPYLISTCFLLINPCLNPVALFYTGSQFKGHLKRYLTYFCKRNSPNTGLELTRRN